MGMWTTTHACRNLGATRPGPRSPNDEPYSYANIAAPLSLESPLGALQCFCTSSWSGKLANSLGGVAAALQNKNLLLALHPFPNSDAGEMPEAKLPPWLTALAAPLLQPLRRAGECPHSPPPFLTPQKKNCAKVRARLCDFFVKLLRDDVVCGYATH